MKFRPFKGISFSTLREAKETFQPILRSHRGKIRVAGLLTVSVTTFRLLQPWPLKVILDRVVGTGSRELWGLTPHQTIAAAALVTFVVAVMQGVLSLRLAKTAAGVSRDLTVGMRRQVFEHLHRLAVPFHVSGRTGELLMRLMGDVNTIRDGLFASWHRVFASVLMFVAMAVVMLVLDPVLALVALLPIPVIAFALPRASRRLKKATRQQRRNQGRAAAWAAESLRQIRLIKAYAAEGRISEQFSRDARSGERAGVRAARISAEMERSTDILTGVGLALVLLVGAMRAAAGALTVGDLVIFLTYARSFYRPLSNVSDAGVRMGRVSAAAERLLELFRAAPEDQDSGRPAPQFAGEVAFGDVRYIYEGGPKALKGVTFVVPPASLAMLIGPNGAGKSTILSLLLRLIDPTDGEIRIDGEDVQSFQLQSYRERFAYVPQGIQLFGATLRENIAYGRPDATEDAVREAARLALLDQVVDRTPGGFDGMLGEGGETLSGGEARRLMLARAAIRDARILLLDEPLTGLDASARETVVQAIRQIASGRTTIVVTHEAMSDFDPDVVIALENGRVAEATGVPDRRVDAGVIGSGKPAGAA